MSLRSLKRKPSGAGLVRFVVQDSQFLERSDGAQFVQMDVADFSEVATLRWWCNWRSGTLACPGDGAVMESMATFRSQDGRLWLDSNRVDPVQDEDLRRLGPVFLPRSQVPRSAYPALEKLVAIFSGVQDEFLRGFLGRVFTDPAISSRFVRCRASANHHHREAGGLLVHSVAVAERCMSCASGLERSTSEVVIAAALLHDIGKLETVGEGPRRPPLAQWVHHEALTLEILAPHLRWLDGEWPHGAALLRHCLTWYSTKPAGFAGFVGADILRAMDGIDVAIGVGKGSGKSRFEPIPSGLR